MGRRDSELPQSFRDLLCSVLSRRLEDPDIEWAYHPHAGLGPLLTECLIQTLKARSNDFAGALDVGSLRVDTSRVIGTEDRHKTIDLVIEQTVSRKLVLAVESTVCMTAHARARPRLLDELRSSLDVLLEADPQVNVFFVVVINFAETYVSPLRPPQPNDQGPESAANLSKALRGALRDLPGLAGLLVVPISFDNKSSCAAALEADVDYSVEEAEFLDRVVAATRA